MKAEHLHRLVWMSRPLMQAAEARVERGLAGTGLTVRMRAVLEILRTHGALTVPGIAARLEINRQYVQLMVNETVAAGLAAHHPNPTHRRSSLLGLTDRGRDLIDTIIASELKVMQDIGTSLREDEVATALKVIVAVTQRLRDMGGEPA